MFFIQAEVWNVIKSLLSRRALSYEISISTLKHCGCKTITYLCRIFNWCARLSYFPAPRKHTTIITIPKSGKEVTNPVNQCPISILNTMSKILEKLILSRLKIYTTSKIRSDQHAYRCSYRTTTQFLRVI